MENKVTRHIEVSGICVICRVEREDTFHTFYKCPMAKGLWRAMSEHWYMPRLEEIKNTGLEWLLHLLQQCSDEQRLPVLMTMWRSWHVRNEVTHNKPAPPIDASRRFLNRYIDSLLCIKQHPEESMEKGKMVVSHVQDPRSHATTAPARPPDKPQPRWTRSPLGWNKLNVDSAFREDDMTGAAGMVLRGPEGNIIFASC